MLLDCEPVSVVEAQLEAFNARDAQAFAAFYAPGAAVYYHPDELYAMGRDSIAANYAINFEAWPRTRVSVRTQIVSGEWVVNDERGSEGGHNPFQAVVVYQVRDCLIQRVEILPILDLNTRDGGQ